MDYATKPVLIQQKWASAATSTYVRTPPFPASGTPGAASFEAGFPPLTFDPVSGGGIPPDGRDFNGVLQMLSNSAQWSSTGALYLYNSAFSTAIGGYPKFTRLMSTDNVTVWVSTADNNTTDPDSGGSSGWVSAEYFDNPQRAGMFMYAGFSAADSDVMLVCDGRSLLRADHARLFAAIGTTWGSVDGTHFTLPDGAGRHIEGAASGGYPANDGLAIGDYAQDQVQAVKWSLPTSGENTAQDGILSAGSFGGSFTPPNLIGPSSDGTHGTPRTGYLTRPLSIGAKLMIYR